MAEPIPLSPQPDPAPVGPWPPPNQGLTRRTAIVAGHRMSYVMGGHGEPVILLHGIGTASATWRYTLPVLAQHFTVYAPDMLGCGESDKPDIDYSVPAMARYIQEFMDAVGIKHAHFIGHSLGGGITLQLFALCPERMDRVVLSASGGMGRAVHWLLRASTLPGANGIIGAITDPRTRIAQASRAMERRRLRRLQVVQEIDEALPTIIDRLHSPETRQAFLSMLRNTSNLGGQKVSALPYLAGFDKPVLLIWGARDHTIPVTHGYVAASLMPLAHLEVLPNCYHRPQIEAPDAFNQQVLAFLQAQVWPPLPADVTPLTREELITWSALLGIEGKHFAAPLRQALATDLRWRRLAPAALVALGIPASVGILLRSRQWHRTFQSGRAWRKPQRRRPFAS